MNLSLDLFVLHTCDVLSPDPHLSKFSSTLKTCHQPLYITCLTFLYFTCKQYNTILFSAVFHIAYYFSGSGNIFLFLFYSFLGILYNIFWSYSPLPNSYPDIHIRYTLDVMLFLNQQDQFVLPIDCLMSAFWTWVPVPPGQVLCHQFQGWIASHCTSIPQS